MSIGNHRVRARVFTLRFTTDASGRQTIVNYTGNFISVRQTTSYDRERAGIFIKLQLGTKTFMI